ncbi:hypothetical protein EVAR_86844_1 [Eumeta japonica]|uniref:Uncharacterized protein n=1 Tax=Eumeta variegata TaxID=151549 RepID=A0A4C1VVE6_EUMVA|nr:hypothetical protein EVAR_86844_1 [Eumeta japonica]
MQSTYGGPHHERDSSKVPRCEAFGLITIRNRYERSARSLVGWTLLTPFPDYPFRLRNTKSLNSLRNFTSSSSNAQLVTALSCKFPLSPYQRLDKCAYKLLRMSRAIEKLRFPTLLAGPLLSGAPLTAVVRADGLMRTRRERRNSSRRLARGQPARALASDIIRLIALHSINIGTQSTPLRHAPTGNPISQSNIITSSITIDSSNVSANPHASNTHRNRQNPGHFSPKTSSKIDDDFDVNEYFARLHGTRYVSAPVNILLKEDQNANLESTEETLEEVNLNDSRTSEDTQQSITADIAQNFSQLPQVLPHVASAVFSSFSNYLSSKSREQTPGYVPKVADSFGRQDGFEIKKPESSAYREVDFQKPENGEFSDKPPLVTRKLSDAKPIGAPPCAPPAGKRPQLPCGTQSEWGGYERSIGMSYIGTFRINQRSDRHGWSLSSCMNVSE